MSDAFVAKTLDLIYELSYLNGQFCKRFLSVPFRATIDVQQLNLIVPFAIRYWLDISFVYLSSIGGKY